MQNIPWFPQTDPNNALVALLKNFVFLLNFPLSKKTIEENYSGRPYFKLNDIQNIFGQWGIKSAVISLGTGISINDIPSPAILFRFTPDRSAGEFIIFLEIDDLNKVVYLSTRKGWNIEPASNFLRLVDKNVLGLVSISDDAGEADFKGKEAAYRPRFLDFPDFKKDFAQYNDFLSDEECNHIIGLAKRSLKPSGLMSDSQDHSAGRTSFTSELQFPEDPILNAIKARAAAKIEIPAANFEWFQCVSYEPGQEYENHYDAFDSDYPAGKKTIKASGQRLLTLLVYLNDDFIGGGTYFPALDLFVQPRKGSALVFRNVDELDRILPTSLHSGKPVTTGRKFALNIWVRTKPFYG